MNTDNRETFEDFEVEEDLKNDYLETYLENEDSLAHYGVKRKSGRYPWGSGDIPYQHEPGFPFTPPPYATYKDFLKDYDTLKKKGIKETDMVKMWGLNSTSELRAAYRIAGTWARQEEVSTAVGLRKEGKSLREIAKAMGYANDSSVRTLLNEAVAQRKNLLFETTDRIKDAVDKYGLIDVGKGAEIDLGVTEETLNQALYMLEAEYGYKILGKRQAQMTNPGQMTTVRVAAAPDTPDDALYNLTEGKRVTRLHNIGSDNTDRIYNDKPSFMQPASLKRDRLEIRYGDEGGSEKDGMIEIRPGVKDLSLGDATYSQVRIMVDNEKGEPAYYLKGMAVYNKDLPKGIDVRINSNKPKGTPDSKALKELKRKKDGTIDMDDPFGALIKEQLWYTDDDGKEKIGLINKRADEGDWEDWTKSLPSQFLAKQNPKLIKQQLEYTVAEKRDELEELKKINNPAVRQYELKNFADGLDSQAVHLKAAALPRQKYQVLLAVPSLKDNEVFAPNFKDGEKLALVRFPHAGPFEIPILTVNNKNKEALESIGATSQDAIGINAYNAGILSGADFDGDTVIAIPQSDKVAVTSQKPLAALRGFDPKDAFPPKVQLDSDGKPVLGPDGKEIIISKVMSKKNLQRQMGMVSNLITDMTLMGADDEEIARAVKHSMVVVDSPKHKLDYRASEIENGIAELKKKYQLHDEVYWNKVRYGSTGAATLLSKAKAEKTVPMHEGYKKIDPETGKYVYTREGYKQELDFKKTPYTLGDEYVDKKTGEVKQKKIFDYANAVYRTREEKSDWMSDTDDARTLVRDPNNVIEMTYADFANSLKYLANEARKESVNTPNIERTPEAAAKYAAEVDSLNNKLVNSNRNKPRERDAQELAEIMYQEYVGSNFVELDKAEDKKLKDKMLKKARFITGAQREEINITDKEWEAIQAGAISHTKAMQIFQKANQDQLRERATPKEKFQWTEAKSNRAIAMLNSGYTTREIAEALGISTSTVSSFLREKR